MEREGHLGRFIERWKGGTGEGREADLLFLLERLDFVLCKEQLQVHALRLADAFGLQSKCGAGGWYFSLEYRLGGVGLEQ